MNRSEFKGKIGELTDIVELLEWEINVNWEMDVNKKSIVEEIEAYTKSLWKLLERASLEINGKLKIEIEEALK